MGFLNKLKKGFKCGMEKVEGGKAAGAKVEENAREDVEKVKTAADNVSDDLK